MLSIVWKKGIKTCYTKKEGGLMGIKQRAKAVASSGVCFKKYFYVRKNDGTIEKVNVADEMRSMARRVEVLSESLELISCWTDKDWWCKKCGYVGTDAHWTEGCSEHPNDTDAFCPKCGRDDDGFPVSFLDEFEPEEYASESIKKASEV